MPVGPISVHEPDGESAVAPEEATWVTAVRDHGAVWGPERALAAVDVNGLLALAHPINQSDHLMRAASDHVDGAQRDEAVWPRGGKQAADRV
jgi:hypothetical protein